VSKFDFGRGSTFSNILINEILKKEFGYTGLIVTDDMNMLHTSTKISVKESIQKAISAGVDQMLYVGFPDTRENIIKTLEKLIETGEIKPERIQESLLKILKAKRDLI
jgi:beta-N-acetylhexosaminidase